MLAYKYLKSCGKSNASGRIKIIYRLYKSYVALTEKILYLILRDPVIHNDNV